MEHSKEKTHKNLKSDWEYTCTLIANDSTFPHESIQDKSLSAFSHGGTISFNYLDKKVKITGQREWRKTKDNANIDSPPKPILWHGEYAVTHSKKGTFYKFEVRDLHSKFKGLEGTTKIVIEHDRKSREVRNGWFHYVPSIDFLAMLAEKNSKNEVEPEKLKNWLGLFGTITLKKK